MQRIDEVSFNPIEAVEINKPDVELSGNVPKLGTLSHDAGRIVHA